MAPDSRQITEGEFLFGLFALDGGRAGEDLGFGHAKPPGGLRLIMLRLGLNTIRAPKFTGCLVGCAIARNEL